MTELFLKINEYNIADDFTKSVESNYNKNKKISPKQIACLNRKIWHDFFQNLFFQPKNPNLELGHKTPFRFVKEIGPFQVAQKFFKKK